MVCSWVNIAAATTTTTTTTTTTSILDFLETKRW
jgi:hypothetical protein